MDISLGFKKYAQNIGYILLGKIIKLVVTFTVGIALIRYLGPEQFGLLSYAMSFVFLFYALADLGLDYIIIRELVKSKDKDEILGSGFLLKIIGSLFALITIFVIINIMNLEFYSKLIISIISIGMLFRTFDIIDFYFQSEVLAKYIVYAQVSSLVLTSILYLYFIYLKLPLIHFAYIVFFETVFTGFGLLICYKLKTKRHISWKVNFDKMKGLLSDSWPLILTIVAISIYMRIDQVMIKAILNVTAVGYYSVAVNIAEMFYIIPVILTSALFPAIINAKLKGEKLYYDRLQKLFVALFWIALGIAIFISIIAKPLISVLYGPKYSESVGVLSLLIWASIFVFLGVGRSQWMISENLQLFSMFYQISGAVLNILLNMFLIPAYGIQGAAIATIISQFIASVLTSLFSKKTRKIFSLQIGSINFANLLKEGIY